MEGSTLRCLTGLHFSEEIKLNKGALKRDSVHEMCCVCVSYFETLVRFWFAQHNPDHRLLSVPVQTMLSSSLVIRGKASQQRPGGRVPPTPSYCPISSLHNAGHRRICVIFLSTSKANQQEISNKMKTLIL